MTDCIRLMLSFIKAQIMTVRSIKKVKFDQPQSELEAHTPTVEDYFRQHPPASIKEATAKIEQLTGIRCSPTQVRNLESVGSV